MSISQSLNRRIHEELASWVIHDYNELTELLKLRILELLREQYGVLPVDNDLSRPAFCEIGEIRGGHYSNRDTDFDVWVANSTTLGYRNPIHHPNLTQALERRQAEVDHARQTKTRITYDIGISFFDSNDLRYDVESTANGQLFKKFARDVQTDICYLLEGLAVESDEFTYCPQLKAGCNSVAYRINDDVIRRIYANPEHSSYTLSTPARMGGNSRSKTIVGRAA